MFKSHKSKILLVVLIIYLVGAIGHAISDVKPIFLMLTPYNLILTLAVYFWLIKPLKIKTILIAFVVFLIGFFVEVVGVKTGLLFGSYNYGVTLGWKFLDVPIVIGFNWVLLSFTSNSITNRYIKNNYVSALLAANLMVGLDYLIEPIAIKLDYWSWEDGIIPIQNFMMWLITAFVIQLILNYSKLKLSFKVGLAMFTIQILFFLLLNFLI
jgi:putative membrane protein